MYRFQKPYFHLAALFFWMMIPFTACHSRQTSGVTARLTEMDSMAYQYPKYVVNHIDSLNKKEMTDYDKSYLELIKIIAADKLGNKFRADSTINAVVEEFSHTPKHFPQNYMRALMYQGIVRYQSGISDNKAYEPIKEALRRSDAADESRSMNLRDVQIANYYLGLIHNKNNNVAESHNYFKQALFIAEMLNDSTVLFKTYRDMYWNRMKALDFFTAKSILQTLQTFPIGYSEEKTRDVRNAEAAFYNSEKRYRNALKTDFELLKTDKMKNDKEAVLADYFRISDNFKSLNKLDSALHYGELATKHIVDSTFYLNYYYYLNVAEIATKMGNYSKSTEAYAKVYSLMNKAITKKLNTQILELEKKHDVSEEQRRAANLKSSNMWLQFSVIMLAFIFAIITLVYRNTVRMRKETEKSVLRENKILEQEMELAEERAKQVELDKKLTEKKLVEKQFVIPIYRQISQRNLDIKNFLMDLKSHNYINNNPQLLERVENEYQNYIQATKINENQFLSDALFADLTGIKATESRIFNESEKLMMTFIATGADNQQMATLLNTSVESIRVRKSKLKKKMDENKVTIPENLEKEIE